MKNPMKKLAMSAVAATSLILSPAVALATPDGTDAPTTIAADSTAPVDKDKVDVDKSSEVTTEDKTKDEATDEGTAEDKAGEEAAGEEAAVEEAAAEAKEDAKADSDLVTLDLYNLTDIHGHIEKSEYKGKVSEAGLAAMSCYIKDAKTKNPNSQLVLLGDNIGASPFTSGSQNDNPTIEALNKMDVFASTIGNHEFDKGQKVLKARFAGGEVDGVTYTKIGFPYLGANVEGMEEIKPYKVWTSKSGVKVAFIGAIEDDAETKVFPGTFDGMKFNKPVPVINNLAKDIKERKEADVVIAMYDNDVERSLPNMGEYVDGLMGGDTHKPYYFTKVATKAGHKISATASGSFTDNLANLRITFDKKAGKVVDSEAIQIKAEDVVKCGEDKAVADVVAAAKKISDEKGAKVIAEGTGNFSRGYQETKKDGEVTLGENRGTESTIGGLIADAMRGSFTTLDKKPIDIGIINAGGIRADLMPKDGKVTVSDVFKVQPFSNEVGYVKMNGAQFKTLLEQQWKVLDEKSTRPMLKLGLSSNVKYTFDPAKKMGERITSLLIDDKPIDPAKIYTVGSVTFLLTGGDSFDVLKEVKDTFTTIPNGLDRDFFGSYLTANPKVQPRAHVHSVGVTVDSKVDGTNVSAKVSLRGLSFSGKAEARTENVTVKLGDKTVTAKVNNTLEDPNAAKENAIVTADGVGYLDQPIEISATATCGDAKTAHLPLTVTDDKGKVLVGEAAGLGVAVDCAGTDKPDPDKPAPASAGVLMLGQTTVERGDTLKIMGDSFAPNEPVVISIHSNPVTVFDGKVDAQGFIIVDWTVPADFALGEHTASIVGKFSSASAKFTVVEKKAAGKSGSKLAHTGAESMSLVLTALLLGGAGVTFAVAGRRKSVK
ncbi:bifunctional metallophosphatase/5'-nucleotidase [Trueperella pecoris]|uniref:Bifunctional metallophosphatase/5'-nucleotidase n=1 Tax=Trueperella pecoris TaxID=2733571 RepID=A0A7M1QWD6_9ACTO|nr:bifunctional UDP-sugar hydrolase/5'-nucleotidase [Trueperella pecoris]QOR45645.1 bifunctional metallophosphatase/5'-nucleotidase [Trueperella pecoris]